VAGGGPCLPHPAGLRQLPAGQAGR
jgi:hypothetical protein